MTRRQAAIVREIILFAAGIAQEAEETLRAIGAEFEPPKKPKKGRRGRMVVLKQEVEDGD